MNRMALKNSSYGMEEDEDDEEEDDEKGGDSTDFDDDEDPDEIEVPGGGKDLATVATLTKKFKSEGSTADTGATFGTHSSSSVQFPGMATAGIKNEQLGNTSTKGVAAGLPRGTGGSVEMAGMGGFGGNSSVGGPGSALGSSADMSQLMMSNNKQWLQNLQAMLVANPHYLTSGIPTKLISQMWMADASKAVNQMPEEEEADEEEMGVAETYAEYWPAKLKIGKKHPDPVVETASLSSVEPCDVYYQLSIPPETINGGLLSALQLESITYASQAHAHLLPDGTRAGFLIGDGAGVGKGRTIAGIIFENYLKGRKKSIWISVSNDLRYDAERDLRDIGASRIDVMPLNKLKYAKINSSVNNNVKKGVIFGTYSALIGESQSTAGKYKTRLKQLLQ